MEPAKPILPVRHQTSTFGTTELNFCVRDGNRCGLSVIFTGMVKSCLSTVPSKLHRIFFLINFVFLLDFLSWIFL